MTPPDGARVGPYELLALVGAGGMGEVSKARDPRLGRMVAIEWLRSEHLGRFEDEARASAALNHRTSARAQELLSAMGDTPLPIC
jgi:serine/threonine protein kinase